MWWFRSPWLVDCLVFFVLVLVQYDWSLVMIIGWRVWHCCMFEVVAIAMVVVRACDADLRLKEANVSIFD